MSCLPGQKEAIKKPETNPEGVPLCHRFRSGKALLDCNVREGKDGMRRMLQWHEHGLGSRGPWL